MLTPEQIACYQNQGYVLVENPFTSDEIETWQAEVDQMIQRAEAAQRDLNATWSGSYLSENERKELSVTSIHNVQYHSAAFARLLVDDRLSSIVADLIGPNVQLHHTKMHAKPPEKGSPFPMHQDYPFFPHEKHTMMAAIIHLDDSTMENGCLCVVPESHKLGAIEHTENNYLPPDNYPLSMATPCPAKAGDILLFNYLTIHGSGVNLSQHTRRIVLFQFRSPDDNPTVATHQSPGQGLMIRGHNPVFYNDQF